MIAARRATLGLLLAFAAAECGSSAAPVSDGPADEAGGGNAEGGAREDAADGATDSPRDAPADGVCPAGSAWGPCEKPGAECVASEDGGSTKYYCVSCGSPLPMLDASAPMGGRWQMILSCPP